MSLLHTGVFTYCFKNSDNCFLSAEAVRAGGHILVRATG